MWTLRKNFEQSYYESSLKLGKVTLWLMAYDNRWAVEIGDNTVIIDGPADNIEDAKCRVNQRIIQLLADTAQCHQSNCEILNSEKEE